MANVLRASLLAIASLVMVGSAEAATFVLNNGTP
jgi:hypothetical protein